MRTIKKINWLLLVAASFITGFGIGFGYLAYMPLAGGEINYSMLITSSISLFLGGLSFMEGTRAYPHRELPWWKAILSVLGVFAGFLVLLGSTLGIFGAGLGTVNPELAAEHRTLWGPTLLGTAFCLFCFTTIWIRYQVAKGTIVILDGKVLYPGTKFTLYPWFRYKVRTLGRLIKIPSTKLELGFTDGKFKMVVRPSGVELALFTAQEFGLRSLGYNYKAFIATINRWVLERLRDQARTQTLGAFLNREASRESANIRGIPVYWSGEAKITLLQ